MSKCLYCQQSDRAFTSEEHVIAESLGNQGLGGKPPIVLPKGVVCDRCNHGKLAHLDNVLINFKPISTMRTFYGVLSKRGKSPETTFGNASLRMLTPGNILFESNSKKSFFHSGQGTIKMNFRGGPRMTKEYCRTLTRALYKIALGCMYLDQPDLAMSARFDPVRRMILDLDRFHGYLVMPNQVHPPSSPRDGMAVTYDFYENEHGQQGTWCIFHYLGFEMMTDLEMRKVQHPELIPKNFVTVFEF